MGDAKKGSANAADAHGEAEWSCRVLRKRLPETGAGRRQPGARQALFTLALVETLNFTDRMVSTALKLGIQRDLGLTDLQTTYPALAMKLVFMSSSLLMGYLADKQFLDRRILLAAGIAVWSVATSLGGFAQDLTQLVVFRMFVGVGEAAFATVATPMIADFYPSAERNAAFTVLGMAAPIGFATGVGVGSVLDQFFGWRWAFVACGFPGILASLLVLFLNDPPVGISDDCSRCGSSLDLESSKSEATQRGFRTQTSEGLQRAHKECTTLCCNPHWLLATCGLVLIQFAIGGLTEWYPTYMESALGMQPAAAGLTLAATAVFGGISGTLLGSKITELLTKKLGGRTYFLVPAAFMAPGAILCFIAVNVPSKLAVCLSMLFGQVCFFTYTAPMETLSISVVAAELRARSASLQNLFLRIFGDVISPQVVGAISDATGKLQNGMQVTSASIALAGICWTCGYGCCKEPKCFMEGSKEATSTPAA